MARSVMADGNNRAGPGCKRSHMRGLIMPKFESRNQYALWLELV